MFPFLKKAEKREIQVWGNTPVTLINDCVDISGGRHLCVAKV